MTQNPMTLQELSIRLGVGNSALSNWQRRFPDFPAPLVDAGRNRLYDETEVMDFVDRHGLANPASLKVANSQGQEALLIQESMEILRNVVDPMDSLSTIAALGSLITADRDKFLKFGSDVSKGISTSSSIDAEYRNVFLEIERSDQVRWKHLVQTWTRFEGKIDPEQLFEQVISRLVRGGTSRNLGQFATADSVAKLIAELAPGDQVLDPCCGVGGLLSYFKDADELVGQEINPQAYQICAFLSQIKRGGLLVKFEDSIKIGHHDWVEKFDSVVVDPPIRLRLQDGQIDPADERWVYYAQARKNIAEDFWIQTALKYLKPSDNSVSRRAVLSLSAGWFFDNAGTAMRDALVKEGLVEAVVALGVRTSAGTTVAKTLLILNDSKTKNKFVRMVDAQQLGTSHRGLRTFSDQEISQIVSAVNGTALKNPNSRLIVQDVPIQEILRNRAALNIERYLTHKIDVEDIESIKARLSKETKNLKKAIEALDEVLKVSRLDRISQIKRDTPQVLRLLDNQLSSYIRHRRQDEDWNSDDVLFQDVVVCLMGSSIGLAVSGEEFLSRNINWPRIWILRTNPSVIDPEYLLAWARTKGFTHQLKPFIVGTTIQTLQTQDLSKVEIPVPTLAVQREIAEWARSLKLIENGENRISEFVAGVSMTARELFDATLISLLDEGNQ